MARTRAPAGAVFGVALALCGGLGVAKAGLDWVEASPEAAHGAALHFAADAADQRLATARAAADAAAAAVAQGARASDVLRQIQARAPGAAIALFQPDGQPAAVSDAAAVAPARAALAAARGESRWLGLSGGAAAVVAERAGHAVVVLLGPAALLPPGGAGFDLATPSAVEGAQAPLASGELALTAPDDLATRVVDLVAGLILALTPLALGLLLLRRAAREERRAQELQSELDAARNRFRVAVNGARAGVFEYDPEQRTLSLSSRLRTMLGASSEHLTLAGLVELAAEEDRRAVREAFEKSGETGVLETAFRIAPAHGAAWIEMRGLALEGPRPGAMRFVGTGIDETPRRDAEARAVAMERRLRAAIEGYSGPFALWDSRRRLVTCNASYAHTFGLAGKIKPGALYEQAAAASLAVIRQEVRTPGDPHVREVELTDGSWLHVLERATPDGGLVIVGTDITALKQHEKMLTRRDRELRNQNARLEQSEGQKAELAKKYEEEKLRAEEASRAKSMFLANMSHELRTPLNAIIGFSEMISSEMLGPLGNAKYQEYSRDILDSGQLLLELINDILDMAKIEAGKITLSPQPLEPREAIEQAVRLMSRRAEEKGLQLVIDTGPLPRIEADHRSVKQMLLNLLSNAVKFTEQGGVMVQAKGEANGAVTITVVDSGPGIPPEFLPRLGRPFERVEMQKGVKQPGAGLGLALTRALAEMHGGSMRIESELGRGTMVSITLPAKPKVSPVEQAA